MAANGQNSCPPPGRIPWPLSSARSRSAAPAPRGDSGLNASAHSTSFCDLQRRFGRQREVSDFCIPTNSYFPPKPMMHRLQEQPPRC